MPTETPEPIPTVESEREKEHQEELKRLIDTLRDTDIRLRTGIVLAHHDQVARLPEIAARRGFASLDYRKQVLDEMPPGAKFTPLSASSEIARLQRLARAAYAGDPLLLYNVDVALSKLRFEEMEIFWKGFTEHIIRPRHGLLIALPLQATTLLPNSETEVRLRRAGRLATLPHAQ